MSCLLLVYFTHCNDIESGDPLTQNAETASFVGRTECVACHQTEFNLWQSSHHDLAMQPANEQTVLGNFDDVKFMHEGVTSTFSKREGKFFVRTEGPKGTLEEYPITYTMGVDPLQQYLIEFPKGRYQSLSLCWDTRPTDAGGQRWFHLYEEERISHDDLLHWTGPYQTWNHMCAECHSTDLKKNYLPREDRYQTTFSEIDIACEACHGPGSQHVSWARTVKRGGAIKYPDNLGFVLQLTDGQNAQWVFDDGAVIARRSEPRQSATELETCARCHSRRSVIHEPYQHGRPLLDTHLPSLLDETLYYPDGQIQDEVYVYGSFLQSKMYHKGVSCSDCHEPHSLKLRSSGDSVCTICHLAEEFQAKTHHFHPPSSSGASCVECHMPATTYMAVDPRRDHSFRIPRPDLSVKIGTPNACTNCHSDRSPEWAATAVIDWYGPNRSSTPHFGEVLQKGREGTPDAAAALARLANDQEQPTIVRASALRLLRGSVSVKTLPVIESSLSNPDPLIRVAALSTLPAVEPQGRLHLAGPLLQDPIRAVRTESARVLASVPSQIWSPEQLSNWTRALAEYEKAQRINADRAESHVNLGVLYVELDQQEKAEVAYQRALEIAPSFLSAYVNLADLYRLLDRDQEGEPLLRKALEIDYDSADVHHALGLLLARQKRLPEALRFLERAAQLQPRQPRYSYVLGVALQSAGQGTHALDVLGEAHKQHPNDRDILISLVMYNRNRGTLVAAIDYAEKLLKLSPQDPGARQLVEELRFRSR